MCVCVCVCVCVRACVTESLCSILESNTTLQTNYISIKIFFKNFNDNKATLNMLKKQKVIHPAFNFKESISKQGK